jgi:hypothetical protein
MLFAVNQNYSQENASLWIELIFTKNMSTIIFTALLPYENIPELSE